MVRAGRLILLILVAITLAQESQLWDLFRLLGRPPEGPVLAFLFPEVAPPGGVGPLVRSAQIFVEFILADGIIGPVVKLVASHGLSGLNLAELLGLV